MQDKQEVTEHLGEVEVVESDGTGTVTLDGEDLSRMRACEVARVVATVTQHAETDADIIVRDVKTQPT